MIKVQDVSGGASFAVKVHPRARRNGITGIVGDALKLDLTAPPIDGKANQSCMDFLAELLEVPPSSVTIAAGHNSRNKIIRVEGLSAEQVRGRLQE
ncbi:MAG TPA: DUF167 domain-containing protein [Terriglobales bacterium]